MFIIKQNEIKFSFLSRQVIFKQDLKFLLFFLFNYILKMPHPMVKNNKHITVNAKIMERFFKCVYFIYKQSACMQKGWSVIQALKVF